MLITNFRKEKEKLFRDAVKEFGCKELYVDQNAYDRYGRIIECYSALRAKAYLDLSDFWNIFNRIERNQ